MSEITRITWIFFVQYLNDLNLPILCMTSGCEDRIVVVHWGLLSTNKLVCSADAIRFLDAEHLLEALLEVVWEEAIEHRVCTGVDVGEDDQGEVDGGVGLGYGVKQVDNVGSEERQPTNDKHQHDDHHHARHLALRLTALGPAHAHACWPHLKVRLYIDNFYEITRAGKLENWTIRNIDLDANRNQRTLCHITLMTMSR